MKKDKPEIKTRITTIDINQLINDYIKESTAVQKLSIYDYVEFIHPKKTKNKVIVTTFGRVLFNSLLPEDYPFINEQLNRKKITKILDDIEQKYGLDTRNEVIHNLQIYMLLLSSMVSPTFELSKLEIPEEILKKRDEIVANIDNMTPVEFDQKVYELYKELEQFLESRGLNFFDMVKSGTKGKAADLIQMFLVWGYGMDAEGNLTPPVRHSLFEGMEPEELYYGSNKARFAGYLKSVGSGEPGYLAVKLRYALNDLVYSKKTKDCKTKKYFILTVTDDIANNILGRYYYDDDKKELIKITPENVKSLISKKIKLRSPLYCKAEDGICEKCIGELAEKSGTDGHLGMKVVGAIYVRALNTFQKIGHQKISAGEDLDFREEFKKYYS